MDLTTWTLVALLIAVVGCLVNIVILIRHVNRLEKNALHQISINHNFDIRQSGQQIQIEDLKGAAEHIDESLDSIKHFNIDQDQVMDDVAILLSGMKANCFSRKVDTDKKFVESLHRINKRVHDLNYNNEKRMIINRPEVSIDNIQNRSVYNPETFKDIILSGNINLKFQKNESQQLLLKLSKVEMDSLGRIKSVNLQC